MAEGNDNGFQGWDPLLLPSKEQDIMASAPTTGSDSRDYKVYKEMMAPDEEDDEPEVKMKWQTNGKIYWVTPDSKDAVAPGLYSTGISDNTGPYLAQMMIETDDLIKLPDSKASLVVEQIASFWNKKDRFRKFGMLHKRGLLLYGPPGSSKTSTIQQAVKALKENHNGIGVFIDHPLIGASCLQALRRVEPDRPVVAIMEDIDELISRHGLPGYLALLDGEAQVNNVLFIATTNHPKSIDQRLGKRPSRFDRMVHIGMPTPEARRAYLKHRIVELAKEEITDEELDRWVELTRDFGIAHLRELIVSVKCLDIPLEEAIAILGEMIPLDEIEESSQFGFVP